MKFRKGQVSTEYLMIVGFALAVIVPISVYFYYNSIQTKEQIAINQVNDIVTNIVLKSEDVYFLGKPSKHTIQANFPAGINSIVINEHEVVFKVRSGGGLTDIHKSTKVKLQGSLRTYQGTHTITIESKGDYVLITD